MELYSGPSRFTSNPTRRDTVSTVDSDKYTPIPPGDWSFTLHGNCARCNHHHKSAVVHIKIHDNSSEASHLICEHCRQKWLTIGGVNTTQLSLLSSRTTELEAEDVNFRRALINIMRSTTSVAAPTALSSVPEATSRHSSRDNSTNRVDSQLNPKKESGGTHTIHGHSKRISGKFLGGVKRKLKETFPILRNVHIRDFVSPMKLKSPARDDEPEQLRGSSQISPARDERKHGHSNPLVWLS